MNAASARLQLRVVYVTYNMATVWNDGEPLPKTRRFADLSTTDFEELLNKKDSKNNTKSTEIAVNVFRDFLQEN